VVLRRRRRSRDVDFLESRSKGINGESFRAPPYQEPGIFDRLSEKPRDRRERSTRGLSRSSIERDARNATAKRKHGSGRWTDLRRREIALKYLSVLSLGAVARTRVASARREHDPRDRAQKGWRSGEEREGSLSRASGNSCVRETIFRSVASVGHLSRRDRRTHYVKSQSVEPAGRPAVP